MRFALRAAYGGANWLVRKQTAVHTAKRTGNYLSFLLVEIWGFEPQTYTLRTYRATNCAISPLWWEQMDSNHRPLACQASALTS